MDTKKTPKAYLENKRTTFLLVGLLAALAIIFVAFEWSDAIKVHKIEDANIVVFEEEMIEQTIQEETPPPPPPAEVPDVIEEIEVVENTKEVQEVDFTSEDNKDKAQEIIKAPEAKPIEPEDDPDYVFMIVEKQPSFPGGQEALMKYLNSNIRYPTIAAENGIQGRVVCQFTVRRDGSIGDIKVLRKAEHPSLDREAVRVIESMPAWEPGKQRGKAVNCKFTLPVVFRLN